MLRPLSIAAAVLVASCVHPTATPLAAAPAASAAAQAVVPAVPRGATIGPGGFATIIDIPPAPFKPSPPGEPEPLTAAQREGQEQFARASNFQNEVMDDVDALRRMLEAREKGNFVDLYFENEGEPHVVFRFLRDPQKTLAKYTRNPRFHAANADYTNEELAAAVGYMMETFAEDRVIMGGGSGNKENRATIDLLVGEEEFRALVARKGVTIPESVKLNFAEGPSAAAVNRPLPTHIAPLVRVFPRSDRPVGIVHSINSTAKVELRDGCFRASDHGNALVQFPMGESLFIDGEGYLAFGSGETPGYARVGETLVFAGSIGEVTAPELVGPIHAACGAGKIIAITGSRSAAAERAQDRASTNFTALRELELMYGLTEAQSAAAFEKCKNQSGTGACLLSPPRPMRAEECPPGSELSGGLCRTPQGHIRPLPEWLKEFAGN